MSNKSSPRRRQVSNKRYDEDFEYYVPVRQYNKSAKKEVVEAAAVEDEEEVVEPKKKRGRAATVVAVKSKTPEKEAKRGPGRPRRNTQPAASSNEEDKVIELDIVQVEPDPEQEPEEPPAKKEKIELGKVLELAVQSMSVTMEEEEEEEEVAPPPPPVVVEQPKPVIKVLASPPPTPKVEAVKSKPPPPPPAPVIDIAADSLEDESDSSSDFEWKLNNGEENNGTSRTPIHSPPAKKKRASASSATAANYIIPTNAEDLEEIEEDGEGRIQVRTIVVGEGEGARIECLSCHRIMKPGSLKAHLKTHAHERPHACDLCEARFTRRGDLERHIKVVHNKDRPFKCSKCHRTFGDKKNLRWHLTNHDRKLFHHCQVCGFKFGKREYWENHVRYIHPIPGTDLEPIPNEEGVGASSDAVVEVNIKESESKSSSSCEPIATTTVTSGNTTVVINIPKSKVSDPVVLNKVSKILNGNKGSPVYSRRGGNSGGNASGNQHHSHHQRGSLSSDPFAGLKLPKVVFPTTYWDNWDEYLERNLLLSFRPSIQRFGSSGRPLRKKKVPDTDVELKPSEKPDSQFELDPPLAEDQTYLDPETGAFINAAGEVVSYPEDLRKELTEEDLADEIEEEEEPEPEPEPVRIDVSDIQMDQPLSGGEVLSTHHLVYGEDGQMRLMVGPGRIDGQELIEGEEYQEMDEDGMLRADLSQAFVESGQIVILQPDGSAVLAPAGGQLVETENGQLILVQTHEDGTQTAVAYATAQTVDDLEAAAAEAVEGDDGSQELHQQTEDGMEGGSNQDAVQTLIDAVQELIDNRQKPS